jgi:hypothetical protein
MKCNSSKKWKYKRFCLKCGREIDQDNDKETWCMIITKRGQKIIEFECFHIGCWKEVIEGKTGRRSWV